MSEKFLTLIVPQPLNYTAAMLKFFVLLLLIPCTAHAYLDPGTGSMIVQVIIGSVLAGLYMAKVYWRKIVHFFKKNKSEA